MKHTRTAWSDELHCALETGYTVTLLSISNLAGYNSVTTRLHGYIIVHQQLSQQTGNRPGPNAWDQNEAVELLGETLDEEKADDDKLTEVAESAVNVEEEEEEHAKDK